jgi:hypothetical protein
MDSERQLSLSIVVPVELVSGWFSKPVEVPSSEKKFELLPFSSCLVARFDVDQSPEAAFTQRG